MSVGGRVVETIVLPDKVWVNTRDGSERRTCAIYVERTAESRTISEGDSVWWQGGTAFWTPRSLGDDPPFSDKKLRRIGFSGVPRPLTTSEPSNVEP